MAFRGYFTLDSVEFCNSSRVLAHLGRTVPDNDYGILLATPLDLYVEDPPGSGLYIPHTSPDGDGLYPVDPADLDADLLFPLPVGPCGLTESATPGLFTIPAAAYESSPGLWWPPDGAKRYGPGLMIIDGTCWGPVSVCNTCHINVTYDDTWTGLADWLGDYPYRPELAPWYTAELPESGEFGGVWLMDVTGLDTTPVERPVTQMAGSGATAGPYRDRSRTVSFDALLVGCTSAGVQYGLQWLTCLLRDTTTGTESVLRYLSAHPGHSGVDPDLLVRDAHGVVLTTAPEIKEQVAGGARRNQAATMYRVTWEMEILSPYAYLPRVSYPVDWDEVTSQPVNWLHAADCVRPDTCEEMPVMFSSDCIPEEIEVVVTPPPVCGGCLPVSGVDIYSYRVPTMTYPFRCRDTAVTTTIANLGEGSLSLQAFWRVCGTDIRCEDNRFPLQVAGLPPATSLVLDGITGRYWIVYDERRYHPVGVVGTPTGAPWRPPLVDRQTCWDFIVQTSDTAEFTVELDLYDREA